MQEEGAFGSVELPLLSTENERAEFEAGVHVREEGRQGGSEAAVLEVEQAGQPAFDGDGLEELGRGLVGVDARRREQADKAIGLDQVHGALDEERVEVDAASTQKRILTR